MLACQDLCSWPSLHRPEPSKHDSRGGDACIVHGTYESWTWPCRLACIRSVQRHLLSPTQGILITSLLCPGATGTVCGCCKAPYCDTGTSQVTTTRIWHPPTASIMPGPKLDLYGTLGLSRGATDVEVRDSTAPHCSIRAVNSYLG